MDRSLRERECQESKEPRRPAFTRCDGALQRRERLQHAAARVEVDLVPDRMVAGHRLAPIGQGEFRIEFLRLYECLLRLRISKVVQQQNAAEKRGLRLRFA